MHRVNGQSVHGDPVPDYIARWTMDDATGADETETYDLTPTGTTTSEAGIIGNAQVFAGPQNYRTAAAILPTAADFTVAGWFKGVASQPDNTAMWSQTKSGGASTYAFWNDDAGSIKLCMVCGSGTAVNVSIGALGVIAAWHHYGFVRTGSLFNLYFDGAYLAQTNVGNVAVDVPLYLGELFSGAAYGGRGSFDDFRVYNRAVSAGDMALLAAYTG